MIEINLSERDFDYEIQALVNSFFPGQRSVVVICGEERSEYEFADDILLTVNISLSMKQAEEKKERAPRHRQENKGPIRPADIDWSASSSDSLSFEDKLSKFKQDSDEKMQTLRRNNDSKRSGGYSRKNTHFNRIL